MNSVRINLMKRTEVRYQGVVSPRFLGIAFGSTLISAVLLLLVVRGVQYSYRKKNIEATRAAWAQMEPRYERLKTARAELAHKKDVLSALRARKEHVARWSNLLLTLQKTVPANIQLGRMRLSQTPKAGGAGMNHLLLKGWSQGDDAEAVVIGWRKALLEDAVYTRYFDGLELGYLRLSGRRLKGTVARRDFELEGESSGGGSGGRK